MHKTDKALGEKLPLQYRDYQIRKETISEESRTVELSFSSELPYERWWGTEVLDHAPGSVRLGRLNDGGALLVDHNPSDHVGVCERATIGNDRMGRAVVRFGKSQRANEIFQDVIDGIRSLVSVGYRIHELKLESQTDGTDTYRVSDWEPYEVSLVAVPADPSVGVGRSIESFEFNLNRGVAKVTDEIVIVSAPAVDVKKQIADGIAREQYRIAEINNFGKVWKKEELATKAISENWPLEDFRAKLLAELNATHVVRLAESPDIGLTEKETQRYSFVRLMNWLANPTDKRAMEAAAFEIECGNEALKKNPIETSKGGLRGSVMRVPSDVMSAPLNGMGMPDIMRNIVSRMAGKGYAERDLNITTATAGGHTVATDLLASSFIDMLTNAMVVMQLGTTMLKDLNGNVAIPRQTSGATAFWVAENAATTESQQAFDQVTLSPKTVGAFTDYSRQLLLQSSIDVEGFIRMDLARTLALAIDLAAINGSGASNQPRGIINTSGIGSVAGGANGLAPTWDHIVDLESAVANVNAAVGTLNYLTNTKVRGKLKRTQMFGSTNGMPVWERNPNALNGYNGAVSNQVPSNLVKGTSGAVASAILFGNFVDLLIGMWGGLDVLVDPYTGGTAGTVRVIALQSVDVSVRHPESFAAMLDALTV